MMKPTTKQVDAGQAIYSKRTLGVYDLVVLGISNQFIWRCPTSDLLAHYNRCVSANHLDVGVGTGYFLDKCQFPSASPRVALMDLNASTLEFASKRIDRYAPEIYRQDVLEPIQTSIPKFDSVGINYLIHCLPGSILEKARIFDHLMQQMNRGALLFGSTILQGGVPRGWTAKRLMSLYNNKAIFSNASDDLDDLERALRERLQEVTVNVIGCVALFSGRR